MALILPLVPLQAAPTHTLLHSFTGKADDGGAPKAGLILGRDGGLYGTTLAGTAGILGSVFKISKDGTGYKVLHIFAGDAGDGGSPTSGLLEVGVGMLFGTTVAGGSRQNGTLYSVRNDGSDYQVLHRFAGGGDGRGPAATLMLGKDGFIYGTTEQGGSGDRGTLFRVAKDGSNYAVVYRFPTPSRSGARPNGIIQGSDGRIYGTTALGGKLSRGLVFSLKPDGSDYRILHLFSGQGGDGNSPAGSLAQVGGNLYGQTLGGGNFNRGLLFRFDISSQTLGILHTFTSGEGTQPHGSVTVGGDGKLYGVTAGGGQRNQGTLFRVDQDGGNFTTVHDFLGKAGGQGGQPEGPLVVDRDGTLFGVTSSGGVHNQGTIFKMAMP